MGTELRFTKEGVPIFDGNSENYIAYRRAALNFVETLEWKKRSLAGPRLQAALEGSARTSVQHKVPGWVSHDRGAVQLLDFLKSKVQAPTLAEAGKMISKFFYQVRRRKGESMSAWTVRHDEALFEARRTLAEAIEEYGVGHSKIASQQGRTLTAQNLPSTTRSTTSGPFRDDGRLDEDEQDLDEQASEHHDAWSSSGWRDWNGWHDWQWNWHSPPSYGSQADGPAYDVSSAASCEAEKFLPDFVVAWMLLQRSGLDISERGAIIANLRNKFSTENVKQALKLNWPDDDLRQRDQHRGSAMVLGDDDENWLHDSGEEEPPEWMNYEEKTEYSFVTKEVEEAYQAYQGARRTLKDARERQTMMRKNRSFYPSKREGPPHQKNEETFKRCFKCGSTKHLARECPDRDAPSGKSGPSANLVFSAFSTIEPKASVFDVHLGAEDIDNQTALVLNSLTGEGKAIIDGGATSSVGSLEALEQIGRLNWEKYRDDGIQVHPGERPSFKFGNNGKTTCLSTATLAVPLGGQVGQMKVAVHDIPGQPVLLSISSLRALGAVIDFDKDEMIMKRVDPQAIVQLERASNGHQVFPLTEDCWSTAKRRHKAFTSFQDDLE